MRNNPIIFLPNGPLIAYGRRKNALSFRTFSKTSRTTHVGWKLTVTVTMKAEMMWHFLDWQSPERRCFNRFLINSTYTCQRSNHNRHPIAIVTGNPTNCCSICLSWWMFDTGFQEAWCYVIFPLPAVPRVALSRYHGSETTESWTTKMAPSCNIKSNIFIRIVNGKY